VDELRVALFRYHLPVVAAIGTGMFGAAGLRPGFTVVRSSREQRELVEAAAADLAHTAVDNVSEWHSAAFPWTVLQVVDLGLPHRLVAQPRYRTLAELRGSRIAVDSARSGFARLLRAIPEMKQLVDSAEFVEVGALAERLTALREETVDACLLGAEQLARAVDAGARELLALNDYFPEYPGLSVSGLPARVTANRDAVVRYINVLCESAAWCFEPSRAAQARDTAAAVLGLSAADAAAWYDAEVLRCTKAAPADGQRRILEAAWRASGRIEAGHPVPSAWYLPDVTAAG
jgi:ABC-type nitrate/sulfonate/bicarbonate transport system substrate-binding protein